MGRLTDRTVRTAAPGRYGDGGSRASVLRYQIGGRRRDLGLGPYPEVGLARGRGKALDARGLIVEGRDPLAERRRTKAGRCIGTGVSERKGPGRTTAIPRPVSAERCRGAPVHTRTAHR